MRISDWSSDVCSSDLIRGAREGLALADSGAGALRGLEEGRPPRQIALSWFKTQSGFAVSDQMAYGNELAGLSWWHLIAMALLAAALVDRKSTRLNSSH